MDQLPPEVLVTIFSKATLKSLLQCRRVCKSWLAALSDPKTSIKLPNCVVLHVDPNDSSASSNSRFVYLYDHRAIPSSDNAILTLASKVTELNSVSTVLVGSCNGLLCWCRKQPTAETDIFRLTISISNPMTGECLTIPAGTDYIPSQNRYWYPKSEVKIGFGYVASKKQYKLVHLVTKKRRQDQLEAKVLTLGNGTWKCLKCPLQVSPKLGVHANGAIHWMSKNQVNICSFDLKTEQFRTLSPPPKTRYMTSMSAIKDCLTVSIGDTGGDLWMMMRGCWVKLKARGFDHHYRVEYGVMIYGRPLVFYPKKKSLVLCGQHGCFKLCVSETKHNNHLLSSPSMHKITPVNLACGNINEVLSGFVPTFVSIQRLLNGE